MRWIHTERYTEGDGYIQRYTGGEGNIQRNTGGDRYRIIDRDDRLRQRQTERERGRGLHIGERRCPN